MLVETHAFKEAFVKGDAAGFVVCADVPLSPDRPTNRIFAEIYGQPGCYHIFETRAAAEFQMALAATGDPPRDGLSVREVRVENIRDYQTLAGFKTVFLVDRDRQMTQSLRVGDMPLAARTNSPFADPRRGVRLVRSLSTPVPFSPKAIKSLPTVVPAPTGGSPVPRRKKPRLDPFADVPFDEGEPCVPASRPTESPRPGFLTRFFRFLFRIS